MPHSRTLLFMPLAHVFARFIQVLCVPPGPCWATRRTPRTCSRTSGRSSRRSSWPCPASSRRSTTRRSRRPARARSCKLFRWAAKAAEDYSRALETGGPGAALRARHALAGRLVHAKLRAALGGRAEFAISGGAPLGERLGHFYRGIGVEVLEGYGLTETTAATAVTRPGLTTIGTVGPAVPRRGAAGRRRGPDLRVRPARVPRLPARRRGDRGGARRRLVPHRRPRARSTTTATCGSPAAPRRSSSPPAARTSPPPCSRTGCAVTRWSARSSSSATSGRSSARSSRSTPRCSPAGCPTTACPPCPSTRPRRTPRSSRRWTAPPSAPTRPSPAPSRSASSACSPPTSPRRTATSPRR